MKPAGNSLVVLLLLFLTISLSHSVMFSSENNDLQDLDFKDDIVYLSVDVPAKFKSGAKGFNEYVRGCVQYPDSEFNNKIEGKVYVKFIIRKDGSVDSLNILKGLTGNLNKEALRLIKNVDYWTPAQIDNKSVSSYIVYPVNFKTSDSVNSTVRLRDVLVELDGRKMPYGFDLSLIHPDLISSGLYIKPYPKSILDSLLQIYGADSKNGVMKITTITPETFRPVFENDRFCIIDSDTIFKTPDILPVYPVDFKEFLIQNLSYPELAKKFHLQGNVNFNLVINEKGAIEKVLFHKDSESYFKRIVYVPLSKSSLWQPAVNNGKNVKSLVTIPVCFYFNDKDVAAISTEIRQVKSPRNIAFKLIQKCNDTGNPFQIKELNDSLSLEFDLSLLNSDKKIDIIVDENWDFSGVKGDEKTTNNTYINVEVCPKLSDVGLNTTFVYIPYSKSMWDKMPVDSSIVYNVVEKMPQFPGGVEALFKFLESNINIPEYCAINNISGREIVRFVVRADGFVSNIEVVKSTHPLLSDEAIRIVRLMPRWIPGMQRGKRVGVYFTLPINFKLQ